MTPYETESRLLRAKRVLAEKTFGTCFFMGVVLDEFTAPEIVKIAQIAMQSNDLDFHLSGTKDTQGWYGKPERSTTPPVYNHNYKPGDMAVCVDSKSTLEGKVFQVSYQVDNRVVSTLESAQSHDLYYPATFDVENLTRVLPPEENENCVKSETD